MALILRRGVGDLSVRGLQRRLEQRMIGANDCVWRKERIRN